MSSLISPSSLYRILCRRALLIIATMICGSILSVLFALNRPAVYEASAVIQIEAPQVSTALQGAGTAIVSSNNRNRLKLIEQKLMSRDSVLAVVEKFDLFNRSADLTQAEKVTALRESVEIVELIDPSQAWRTDVQPSGLVITARLEDPEQAADVANELLAQVLVEGKKRSEGQTTQTLAFFEAEEARISAAMDALEIEFARYKEQHADSLPSVITDQREQLALLRQNQLTLENRLIQIETSSERLRTDERVRQAEVLRQQIALVNERIAGIERALAGAPEVERVFTLLARQSAQLQTEYQQITQRRTEAAMARQLESQDQFERFEVLETALVPEYAVTSRKFKIVLAGCIASVFGALGLALLIELLSPVLRTSRHVEQALDVRPVVIIPHLRTPRGYTAANTDRPPLRRRLAGLFGRG
ncbi:Wzz/FepE/Etk N-terminal domain-containing protein [Thalassobius sp. Cn5-15]|uniref:Wzz/FepE/Etk N-terminal domain-containing protein n=1 Tax=Thalassobius sp. Cn5-15 TaxID=2917763 RepID=UPI001EF19700|nr:Wzz/FepE/Etk N-terminal domain-containing protein [Thalassobius sp. Cn5-15]MCG7494056.1 Wzz/FepE/Etk N-terminal domain-containing protein [Thalassobius sp. Cn5-15]